MINVLQDILILMQTIQMAAQSAGAMAYQTLVSVVTSSGKELVKLLISSFNYM